MMCRGMHGCMGWGGGAYLTRLRRLGLRLRLPLLRRYAPLPPGDPDRLRLRPCMAAPARGERAEWSGPTAAPPLPAGEPVMGVARAVQSKRVRLSPL